MLITLVVLSLLSVLSSGQLEAPTAALNLRVVEDLNSLKSSNNSLRNAVHSYESVNKNELSAFLYDIDINTLAASRKGIIVPCGLFDGDYGVGSAGDFNGDGLSDIFLGHNIRYVLFGQTDMNRFNTLTHCSSIPSLGLGLQVPGTSDKRLFSCNIDGDRYSDIVYATSFVFFGRNSSVQEDRFDLGQNQYGFVSCAGNFNGDGYDDIIGYTQRGESGFTGDVLSVYFGRRRSSFSPFIPAPFHIYGGGPLMPIYSRAADINGDGFTDIIISTERSNVYIIFGHSLATPFPNIDLSLSLTDRGLGFKLFNGPWGYQRCTYVDINGDGFNDIAIAFTAANSRDGMIIVVFGHSSNTPFPDIDLSTNLALAGVGFKLYGVRGSGNIFFTGKTGPDGAGAQIGYESIDAARDVDGDGISDLMFSFDTTYVLYGATTFSDIYLGTTNFTSSGTGHMIIGGTQASTRWYSSFPCKSIGDFNGDGKVDTVCGDRYVLPDGRVAVVLGTASSTYSYVSE